MNIKRSRSFSIALLSSYKSPTHVLFMVMTFATFLCTIERYNISIYFSEIPDSSRRLDRQIHTTFMSRLYATPKQLALRKNNLFFCMSHGIFELQIAE